MKWGIRRYQNKDGTLTKEGKEHLANKGIRTEENLVEKTIPKGTKMYRTTPYKKDGRSSKSVYVSYLDMDRNLYKEGSTVRSYVGKKYGDVYEHEYILKDDIRVPSLKTIREVERSVLEKDPKKYREIGKAWVESQLLMDKWEGYTPADISVMSKATDQLYKNDTPETRKKIYNDFAKKYGDEDGDRYYNGAYNMYYARKYIVNCWDQLTVEQALGRADSTKQSIINELKKRGYNAMYDNASIGVPNDGGYSKTQEGVEPLIIFDANNLQETTARKINADEQKSAGKQYRDWQKERDETLRRFQD